VNNEAVGFIAQIEDDNFEEGKGGGFAVERIVRERTLQLTEPALSANY
jgi:hypothetical protein